MMRAIRSGRLTTLDNPLGQQRGFTLVELMVSLLIGLVIVLGATQLFMISRQAFERVEDFGLRQGALNFSVDVLSRDVRRANRIIDDSNFINWDDKDNALILGFSGLIEPGHCGGDKEIIKKTYFLAETTNSASDWSLYVDVKCNGGSHDKYPLVSGFMEGGLGAVAESPSGLWELTLGLAPIGDDPSSEEITFLVMNRMRALGADNSADDSADEPESGYDNDGNKLYPNACYRGGEYDPDKPGCRI